MLREVGEFDGQGFSFSEMTPAKAPTVVSIDNGAEGATATITDAHLLFNSDFSRSGNDLHLNGHDGERAIVRDYFTADERVALVSREGARLSPDVIEALTGGIAPSQYAQAGQPAAPAANDAVGRVVSTSGDAVILRNGAPVTLRPGDPVLRADVLQTTSGTMAVTFNDGSTLNLTANTRIVVSEFVYSPNGAGNSQLLDLVQGSLTFISGEVAHSGNMRIGTPVATMGIRGTVGGVTTASDGTVQFYVSQSNVGAVIINAQGQIIANVVQDGPMIIVRPIGPLQVIAEELQKTPQQLAIELQALQAIVNIKAVGDQLLQQFQLQQTPNPNPQTPQNGPHTQFQTEQKLAISFTPGSDDNGGTASGSPGLVSIGPVNQIGETPGPGQITVPMPPNLAPVTFAPLNATLKEDATLSFSGNAAIVVADSDSGLISVKVTVPFGTLATGALSGAELLLSGSPAAVNAMLAALSYKPPQDYNGPVTLTVVSTDGTSAPITTTVSLNVTAVNDAPVLVHAPGTGLAYTENDAATVISSGLTLKDVDSSTLSGAKVFISGNFASGQDVLSFTAQGGITGSYDAQTGILTLTETASLADYQAVLRSVTYENTSENPSGDARTISFQVNDGGSENGASTTTTVTVDVTPVNDAPVLNSFNIDLNGDEPVTLTTDMFNVTDPDGPSLTFTVTNVTGGSFVVDTGNNLFSVMAFEEGGTVTFTAQQIADGLVKFVPDGSGDPVSYSVSVSDGVADPTEPVERVDNVPVAENIATTVVAAPAVNSYNIVIVLDTSGSMDGARLVLAKQAIANLLGNENVDINSVMAVSFASAGNVHKIGGSPWLSADQAKGYFQSVNATGGTNYADAVSDVMTAWTNPPGDADKTLVYFISDGEPTNGQGLDDVPGLQALWEAFLHNNGIDAAYAIGISTGVNDTDLAPIAWAEGKPNFSPIVLTSADGLDDTLQSTVIPTHNIFDDTGTSYGGDDGEGAHIASLVVNGVTYSWNGRGAISSSNGDVITGASVTIVTALGGTLVFYFSEDGGHEAGDWTYTPPASVSHSTHDIFTYTIADADGDKASANIDVLVQGANIAPLAASDTVVIDEDTSGEGLRAALLVNDSDADHDTLTITAVSNATHGTVDLNGGDPIFTPDANFSGQGSFTYTVSDGVGGTATATVNVDVKPVAETPVVTSDYTAPTGGATPVATGGEFRVNTGNGAEQPTVTTLSDGGFVVTWTSLDADASGIFGQRYDSSGAAAGVEFQINSYSAGQQTYSSIIGLEGGGFVATWTSTGQDSGDNGVYGRLFDENATAIGGEFRINSSLANVPRMPSVAALDDGGFVATWLSYDNNDYGIFAQRFTENGAAVGGEFRVNSYTYNYQNSPSVAGLENGGFLVTWSSRGQDGSWEGIYAQRYDENGAAAGAEFRVNTHTGDQQRYPAVADLKDGGFVVTWMSYGQDGSDNGVYGQRYDANGAAAGGEFRVNTYTLGDEREQSVTGLDDGGFLVTWASSLQSGNLYGQRFDNAGVAVGNEFLINQTTDGLQYFAADGGATGVAAFADGQIVQVWYGAGVENEAGYAVYGRIFDVPLRPHLEDMPIALSFTVDFGNDSSEGHALMLTGLPTDFIVSDGEVSATSTGVGIDLQYFYLGALTITPAPNWNGTFTATLTASNYDISTLSTGLSGETKTASQSVTITVNPVHDDAHAQNDHLIFASDNVIHVEGGDYLQFPLDYIAYNDSPDGDQFTDAYAELNNGFVPSGSGSSVSLGAQVIFTPSELQSAPFTDTFIYSISNMGNNGHATSTATVTVSVVAGSTLTGGATDDILVGSHANETMTGNAGVDGFVFHAAFGQDMITDFKVGTDRLVFENTTFQTAQDVLASLTGTTDAVIHDGANTITLTGVAVGSLTVDDILIHNYLV